MREGKICFKVSNKNFSSFCSALVRFLALLLQFSWTPEAGLEVGPTQILELADEVFCAAEVPTLQGVLCAGPAQSASSALLRRSCLSQTEQSRKSAPVGAKNGQPKVLQRVAK
jgi:hypothetical protein